MEEEDRSDEIWELLEEDERYSKCNHCGLEILEEDLFCPRCGRVNL